MADLTNQLQATAGAIVTDIDADFKQTVLLLHGDGTNGAQNNTYLDGSTNNFTITRNGNTTQGTFSPFSGPNGYWSNFFDGTNDRLTIADNAALRPGTSAFTIEAWVYRAAAGAAHTIFAKGASTPTGFAFLITSSDTLRFTDTSTDITSTGTVAANTWVHVAAVREGTGSNQLKLYINGVQDGTGTSSTNFTQTEEARIGENRGATDDFNGYISNFRYVIGTALYTAGFTPSTSPLTTTSQGATSSQVELLTCQSNRFLDNSSNAFSVSPVNNVRVTPFSPFAPSAAYDSAVNGGSGYFDGTGDYLNTTSSSAFNFGSGDFTVECWLYLTALSRQHSFFDARSTNTNGWVFYINSSNQLTVYDGTNNPNSTATIKSSEWSHVAFARSGSTLKAFLNGVEVISAANSKNNSTNVPGTVGASYDAGGSTLGYIADLRVVKGTAVYTAAFTPPTAPLTAITNTSLLCNFTNAGIFDNTGKNNLETVGNAQIDTGTKKYGTGSMEFDGTGDWLLIPYSPEFVFGSGNFTIEGWVYPSTTGTAIHICGVNNTSTPAVASQTVVMYKSTTEKLISYAAVGGTSFTCTSSGNLTANQWSHVAFVRSGSTLTQYINGTADGTANISTNSINNINSPFAIGQVGQITTNGWNGFIDDLRITKGVARYTANFTAPTKAFPDQ